MATADLADDRPARSPGRQSRSGALNGDSQPTGRLHREDKLWILALVLHLLTTAPSRILALPGGGVQPWVLTALLVLAIPLHVGLSRRAERFATLGRAAGLVAALVPTVMGGLFAWRLLDGTAAAGGSILQAMWVRNGVPGSVTGGLLLLVPALRFLDATRNGYRPAKRDGWAGLSMLSIAFGLSWVTPPDAIPIVATYLVSISLLYAAIRRHEREAFQVPVQRRQALSVILITRDEEDRLARCLESVAGWADEIVVLDSGSTDGTVELARRYTDRVEVTDWPGYGPQKQRALRRATCDWVLSIDADEEVTPELRHSIDAALCESPASIGYHLPWGVVVYGKLLDFGRSARAPLRLFRREGVHFTDDVVHETVKLPPGPLGTLSGRLMHYTHRDFGHALNKNAKYAWLGSQRRFRRGKRGQGLPGAVFRGVLTFVQVYVVRLGFLDGGPGFVTAVLYGQGAFNKYAGLWAMRRENRQRDFRVA